jgi:hypothetical protein
MDNLVSQLFINIHEKSKLTGEIQETEPYDFRANIYFR